MTFNSKINDLTLMHMAQASFSFCSLLLCASSHRHMNFQYCWWKKSCTTFKGLHLKPRAPNLTLFEDTVIKMDLREWRKSCTTCQHVIQHWASGCGGTSYALANPRLYRWCRISSTQRRKIYNENKGKSGKMRFDSFKTIGIWVSHRIHVWYIC